MILFEGNRVMLFRTALALMELYGTGQKCPFMCLFDISIKLQLFESHI